MTIVKDQTKRFQGFLNRTWIPNTPEELEAWTGIEKSLVGYVETLLKQTYNYGYLDGNMIGYKNGRAVTNSDVKFEFTKGKPIVIEDETN